MSIWKSSWKSFENFPQLKEALMFTEKHQKKDLETAAVWLRCLKTGGDARQRRDVPGLLFGLPLVEHVLLHISSQQRSFLAS